MLKWPTIKLEVTPPSNLEPAGCTHSNAAARGQRISQAQHLEEWLRKDIFPVAIAGLIEMEAPDTAKHGNISSCRAVRLQAHEVGWSTRGTGQVSTKFVFRARWHGLLLIS